ncbi:hypothetical protein LTS15_007239 [Exophiala xenobiotica]|nr:hypothetical protein LTS15_007239 [Exophiala xenobiotica]
MNERTQIENELELLELEERQLLIEERQLLIDRKRVELKQRLQAITTQDSVGLTIAGISPEIHQEPKQVADEATVVQQNKKGETSSAIVEPVVAAAPIHDSAQKRTRRAILREASRDTASSGTVELHETTFPAVRQAVAETSLLYSPLLRSTHTSPQPLASFTTPPPVTTQASRKRTRRAPVKQDKIATDEEEIYADNDPQYDRRTGAVPAKRARTTQTPPRDYTITWMDSPYQSDS